MLSFQKRQRSSGVKSQRERIYRLAQIQKTRLVLRVKEGEVEKDHDGVPAFRGRHAQSFACQASCAVGYVVARAIIAGTRLTNC